MTELEIIEKFIDLILEEWDMGGDLTKDDFLELWMTNHPIEEEEKEPVLTNIPTISQLRSMKKTELQVLCKERGLPDKGVKNVLIDRILGRKESPQKKSKKGVKKSADILLKLMKNQPQLNIRRNLFGNYEHIETRFVFDEVNEKVIGKQQEDGKVSLLTADDIEICQQHNFNYDLPENLNV